MDNDGGKEFKHGEQFILSILGLVCILLGSVFFIQRSESISSLALAQTRPAASTAKKKAEEFTEQRKNASQGQWLLYIGNPVLRRGKMDSWDDFKVGSPVVLKEGDLFRMWYRGCHFIGDEFTCGVGHAVSEDGVIWKKSPGPVLVIEDTSRSGLLDTITLLYLPEKGYMMWYSLSSDWFAGRHYATINLAVSEDGLNWRQEGAVLRAVRKGTTISPSAFYDGKVFHLWYVDGTSAEKPKALMHVTSPDGRKWQVAGWTFLNTLGVNPGRLWILSEKSGGYRGIFAHRPDENREKGFLGQLVSADGNIWEMGKVINTDPDAPEKGVIQDAPSALPEPNGLWVWFVMRPEDGAETINAAYGKGKAP